MASSEARYDAIVIGAGIAGMMAATDLNHRGHRVLVLEHNHQPGGLMAGVRRKGFYFDVGCQSFENMGIIFPLLEQYGLGEVARFHRVRYRVKMPGIDTVIHSLSQAREDFKKAFPEVAGAFDKVFDVHDKTSELIQRLFAPGAVPYVRNESPVAFGSWLLRAIPSAGSLKSLMLEDFTRWYERTMPACGPRDLLSQCGYSRMNVFVASAFWHLWAEDYWYPDGGYQAWFHNWMEALRKRGVEFQFKQTVVGLEKQGRRVSAVLTRKGNRFESSQIVYSGDYKQAVQKLIGPEYYSEAERRRLEEARHSDALVSVYLGLNVPPEKLKEQVRSSHIFYFPTYDCKTELDLADPGAHKKAFLEVTAHCVDDPSLAPPGKSSIVLQAFTRHEWLENWKSRGGVDRAGRPLPLEPGEDESTSRPTAYLELKQAVANELISTFEGIFPTVREHIEYVDVGSPLTAVRFTRNHLGGTCGFELNWKNYPFLNPLAHTRSPLENLHMAGHFTVWPGAVPTAALSGKIAALRAHRREERRV